MAGLMESDAVATRLAFDAVEIDAAGRRLWVDGVETPLEPKAFDALVWLVQRAGRVCTREELLDAVWGHRHITPSVLSRIITQLRHALGEHGDEPCYLHTVHGIGYRFDAEVHAVPRKQAQERQRDAEADVPALDPRRTLAETPSMPAALAPAPSPIASEGGIDAAAAPEPGARRISPRHVAAALLGLLLAIGLGAWLRHRGAEPPASVRPSVTPTLIVLPLRAIGGSHDETVLADGLSEELTTQLARAEGLQVISNTSARLALEQHLDPRQLAQRVATTHALEGSLRQAGDSLRIDLRLVETPSGRTLWAQDYERKLADVFAIQREISQAVGTALAARLDLLAPPQAGKIDLAQYREYVELRTAVESPEVMVHAEFYRPRVEAAVARLRELVARAPDDSMALGFLARLLAAWHDLSTQTTPAGMIEESERLAARALELDPDNANAHEARSMLAWRRMDWGTSLAESKQAIALAPADVCLRSVYAYHLGGLGYIGEAQREAETAARADPLVPQTRTILARMYDTAGRHDEAKRAYDTAFKLDPAMSQWYLYSSWFNAFWRGDFAAAEAIAARIPVDDPYRETYLAVARTRGDPASWPDVLPLFDASERQQFGRYNVLRWSQAGFEPHAAFARIESMLREGSSSFYLLLWQPEYAHMRRTPEFQEFLRNTHILDYWRAHGFPPQCRPDGDGARCD